MTHRRTAAAWTLVVALLAAATPLLGQASKTAPPPARADLHEGLATELDTENFTNPMVLKDFVGLLHDRVKKTTRHDLPIFVNVASFREEFPDSTSPLEAQVGLPPFPDRLTALRILEAAVDQINPRGGIVFRDGRVEIVTREQSTLPALLWQRVLAKFDETPLDKALRQLSDKTGVSIVVDPRVKERKATPITAEFRRDVNLESALRMLANMADLKIVLMDRGVFVTTPENAATLEQELKKRRDDRQERGETDPERPQNAGAV